MFETMQTWSKPRQKLFLCLLMYTSMIEAEEDKRSTSEVAKDCVLETAQAVCAGAGAVAACETGNLVIAESCVVISGFKAFEAFQDAKELWNRMTNDPDDNCEHSCSDHGGNDDHEGSNT